MHRPLVLLCIIGVAACGPELSIKSPGEPAAGITTPAPVDTPPAAGKTDETGERTPSGGTKGPPYPIVLVHGLFGFDKIGTLEGFPGVIPALQQDGHDVYAAKLDPLNDSTVRGEQLATFVDAVCTKADSQKVILIAHSQGGLDARYAAAKLPNQVAAVVTISTPHKGAALADYILTAVDPKVADVTDAVLKLLGKPFFGPIVEGSDSWAALNQLTAKGMQTFNAQVKDQPGVVYYSISGRSGYVPAQALCAQGLNPPFIAKYAAMQDTISMALLLTAVVAHGSILAPEPHDGIVRVKESIWGTWLGCIPADHLDESAQGGPAQPGGFDALAFYRDLVGYLRAQGL